MDLDLDNVINLKTNTIGIGVAYINENRILADIKALFWRKGM
jgi:hypothetical protein